MTQEEEKEIEKLFKEAEQHYYKKEYTEAIECYDKILNVDENNIDAVNNKGVALYNLEKYTEAIKCYDELLSIDDNNLDALNNKGLALYNLGKYAEAIKCYDELLSIDNNYFDALNNKGVALAKLEKYTEAIKCYDEILSIDNNNFEALNNKGVALYNLEKYTEAIKCYDEILSIDDNNFDALNNKGVTLYNLGKYAEAIKCYDKILSIDNNYFDALNNKGVALAKLEKYTEAIEYYDKILATDPNNINALGSKGNALMAQNKDLQAIECYDKILATLPNNINTLNNKGLSLNNLRKYTEAIEYYNKILVTDPNNINALGNKGNALMAQNKDLQAIECYNKILVTDPNNIKTLNNKGIAFLRLERNEEALKYFEKALKINPNDINTLLNKAITLLYISSGIDTKECAECFAKGASTPLIILNKYRDNNKVYKDRLFQVVKLMIEKDPLFISATQNQIDENKKQQYVDIYFQTLQIVSLLHVTGNKEGDKDFRQEQEVAHYTKRDVSYNMLLKKEENGVKKEKSPLRLNTIAKGNDPKEGKTLFDYLHIDRDCDTANDDYQAFIACFTFNKQSLNQFRLYGKEKQQEATGVSLVVKNSYFNNQIELNASAIYSIEGSKIKTDTPIDKTSDKKLSLFRCIYIDPATYQVISIGHKEEYEIYRDSLKIKETDTLEEIEKKGKDIREKIKSYNIAINVQLEKVRTQLSSLNKYINDNKDKLDMQVVKELLIMLRYLVKHVAFKEEQECRILRIEKIDNDEVKVENNIRMFINYNTIDDAVKTIYTGPMFEDAKLYRDVIRRQCKDIDVYICDHPFFSK